MGCKPSLCTDSNELLSSQYLQEKEIDITIPVSEKSTNQSLNTLLTRNIRVLDSGKPMFLLKSFCKLALKSFDNDNELSLISELWISEIFRSFEESVALPEDLRTFVSMDSSGSNLWIKHEIDSIRSYEKVAWFSQKIQGLVRRTKVGKFKYKNFIKSEDFLMSLGPLTISAYLKLGSTVDCGIGIEKPLDRKQMSQFLSLSSEAKNIATWSNNNGQPIPIGCSFSALSTKKTINFYIFDGLKDQNFQRGFSAFYHFGAPVPERLQEIFTECKGEELNCLLEFDNDCITSVSLMTKTPEVNSALFKELDTTVDEKKWSQFQNFFSVNFLSIELSSDGFLFRQYSQI
jgi:hypothetical protein